MKVKFKVKVKVEVKFKVKVKVKVKVKFNLDVEVICTGATNVAVAVVIAQFIASAAALAVAVQISISLHSLEGSPHCSEVKTTHAVCQWFMKLFWSLQNACITNNTWIAFNSVHSIPYNVHVCMYTYIQS